MTQFVDLDLRLEDPTAMTDGSSEASAHRTLAWIPGTSLLGAAVSTLGIPPTDHRFVSLFLSDTVRFLDGHPCIDGSRTRPRPLSLATYKTPRPDGVDWFDRSKAVSDSEMTDPFDRCRGGFMLTDPAVDLAWPFESRDHVGLARDRRVAAEGILFSYEAISAGSTFRSRILVDDPTLLDLLVDGFNRRGSIRIGRSRNGGYGRVEVAARLGTDPTEPDSEGEQVPDSITLASDFCPPAGVSPMDGLRRALAGMDLEIVDAWADTRVVRGFKGVWGLPRPSVEVLRRGSVIRVSGRTSPLPPETLHAGIGRRRNEGFGRFSVNAAIDAPVPVHRASEVVATERRTPPDASTTAALGGLRRRAIRREIDEVATAAISSMPGRRLVEQLATARRLRPSQLSNLRAAVAHPEVAGNPGVASDWFEGVCEKSRGDAWRKTIVSSIEPNPNHAESTMEDLVKNLLGDPDWELATRTICLLADRAGFVEAIDEPADRHRLIATFLDGLVSQTAWRRRRLENQA